MTTVPAPVKADPLAPRLSAKLLARLYYLRGRRRQLESEARQLKSEEDQLADCCLSWLEQRGLTGTRKHGFKIDLKIGRAYPKWQQAFVRFAGAEAAQEVIAGAPRSTSVDVVPLDA